MGDEFPDDLEHMHRIQSGGSAELSDGEYAMLCASPFASFVLEPESERIIEVNGAFERLFKLTRAELLGRTTLGLFPEASERKRLLEMVKAQGFAHDFELHACTQLGEPLLLSLRVESVRLARRECVVGFIQDIGEQRRLAQALHESEDKFVKVFKAAPYSISIVDLDRDRYLDVNEGFERLFGCRREQIVGRPVSELALWADENERRAYLEALLRDGMVWEMPTHGRRADGTILVGLASGVLLKIGDHRCLITFARDLTEQLKAEKAKSEIEAQLRQTQKLEALGTLAGGIAHDFSNILGAIMAFTELLPLDIDDPPAFAENLDMLRQANQRAKELVQQILMFSRRKPSQRGPIRIAAPVREAVRLLRSTLPSTVEIRDLIDEQAPIVLADASQIHQVVMNLATNAVHAMGDRPGLLTVTVKGVDISESEARSRPDLRPGPNVLLSVSDTGCGMDEQTLHRVFEPFFTTKGPNEGTGLGLAVVHGIARGHDAALTVRSELGVGTTFELHFPEHWAELSVEAEAATTLTRGRGERVLVVDDEPALRYGVARLLERLGYAATACDGPVHAIEQFKAEAGRFDVVLTDLNMPNMNGAELAVQLLQYAPAARIIVMSGFNATWSAESLRKIGVCQLLSKPLTAHELSRSLRAALDAAIPASPWSRPVSLRPRS